MAATDSELVRVYRDIEGDERTIQDALENLVRIRRAILALDEKICDARLKPRPLQSSERLVVWYLGQVKTALYRRIEAVNDRIARLRQWPSGRLRLQSYLEACHSFDLAMIARDFLVPAAEVVMHGEIQPMLYPRYIVPSPDFAARQLSIWHKLAGSATLRTEACYPSMSALELLRERLDEFPVGCQQTLGRFMRNTVDEAVDTILDRIAQDERLVRRLEIGDVVETISEPSVATIRTAMNRGMTTMFAYRQLDETNSQRVAVLVSCYRPPHRLSLSEILMGLRGDIHVERDVIGRIGKNFVFTSKCLVAAVITQLFHRMLEVGAQFGYISTGEALVFVEILEGANHVCFSVCIPRHDVESDAVQGLHRTAAAQVLAFTLRALRAEPMPLMTWYTAVQSPERWNVNADNVLNRIPPMLRKMKRNVQYVPHSWTSLVEKTPIRKRLRYMVWPGCKSQLNETAFNDYSVFKFLPIRNVDPEGERIDQWPFCTQRCILGLAHHGDHDRECPNSRYHGDDGDGKHIMRADFLERLQTQLDKEVEKGDYTNCQLVSRSGFHTALFKVRLASHSYTLLIKGVLRFQVRRLRHEADMYGHLTEIQGVHVPVCLGMIQTRDPINRAHGDYASFMVLGGLPAGLKPLRQCVTAGVDKGEIVDAVAAAFEAIHGLRVLQFDPEPRNMLYDAEGKRAVIADFERAVFDEFGGQQVLDMSVTRVGAATRYAVREKISDECFAQERAFVRDGVVEFCEKNC